MVVDRHLRAVHLRPARPDRLRRGGADAARLAISPGAWPVVRLPEPGSWRAGAVRPSRVSHPAGPHPLRGEMNCDEGQVEELRALVKGSDWAPLGARGNRRNSQGSRRTRPRTEKPRLSSTVLHLSMEPAGIEPATSCLQSVDTSLRPVPGSRQWPERAPARGGRGSPAACTGPDLHVLRGP